ncbi:MAG: signal peptidase I [Polyangiaceae bacterium]
MAVPRAFRRWLSPLFTLAGLFAARASLADHYTVPTGSMEPTVQVGDHVCVDKRAYGLRIPASETYVLHGHAPARGEVVVLNSPSDDEVLLKRVAAVPGDVVSVRDGRLLLNGVEVPTEQHDRHLIESLGAHPHELGAEFGGGPDLPPTRVPSGHFLVLGDNRGNSRDGRYFGWVTEGAILGRAAAVCLRHGRPLWLPL